MLKEFDDVNAPMSSHVGQSTCGDFSTEAEACAFFDDFMKGNQYFVPESEVPGRRLYDAQPIDSASPWQKLRIDRIIHPTINAFQAGWYHGPIGIEIKKSGIKIGGVIAQVSEHRTTVFRSNIMYGTRIMPVLFAIFPAEKLLGDIASVCAQSNILTCSYKPYNHSIKFTSPSMNCLEIFKDKIKISEQWKPSTRKGHRGTSNV